jgi:hypothetical protein
MLESKADSAVEKKLPDQLSAKLCNLGSYVATTSEIEDRLVGRINDVVAQLEARAVATTAGITALYNQALGRQADHVRRIADHFERAVAEGRPPAELLPMLLKALLDYAGSIASSPVRLN